MRSSRFIKASERSKPEQKAFIEKNLDVIEQIYKLMDQKHWSQKDLAKALEKSESEISKWLSGLHNFTFKTIVNLEYALSGTILVTPLKQHEELFQMAKKDIARQFMLLSSNTFFLEQHFLSQSFNPVQQWYHAKMATRKAYVVPSKKSNNKNNSFTEALAA